MRRLQQSLQSAGPGTAGSEPWRGRSRGRPIRSGLRWLARPLDGVVAGAHQFDNRQREVRVAVGIGGASARHKLATARTGSGVSGNCRPRPGPSSRSRSQRSGARTTRRMLGEAMIAQEPGRDAIRRDHEVLDQLARPTLRLLASSPTTMPSFTTGRASTVWMSSAPRWCRRVLSRCATSSWSANLRVQARNPCHRLRHRARCLEPCRHAG